MSLQWVEWSLQAGRPGLRSTRVLGSFSCHQTNLSLLTGHDPHSYLSSYLYYDQGKKVRTGVRARKLAVLVQPPPANLVSPKSISVCVGQK